MPEVDPDRLPTSQRRRYEAYVASTRPVRLRGDKHITQFTHEALEDMVAQIRDQCVWLNVEHLEFLPPLGRWKEARLHACDDGEHELFFIGEEIPHYVIEPQGIDKIGAFDDLPTAVSPSLAPRLTIDRRNYDGQALSEIASEADFPVHPRERWAELPPLIFTLLIPVVWGATRFMGSFLDELGKATGAALAAKIESWARRSREPDRALVFVIDFEISDSVHLHGYVIAPPSDVAGTIRRALDEIEQLAVVAGLQATQNLLPGMVEAAYFFDGEDWRLGWWTDGERVISTIWFNENEPDCQLVLGRPLLSSSVRSPSDADGADSSADRPDA